MSFDVPNQIADEAYDIELTSLAVKAKIRQAKRTGRLQTTRLLLVHRDAMSEQEEENLHTFTPMGDDWYVVKDRANTFK